MLSRLNVAGDAASTRLGNFCRRPSGSPDDRDICSGVRCSSVHKNEISLLDQRQWAGFTYDAYCEAADSASDITCCVAGQIELSASGPSGPAGTGASPAACDRSRYDVSVGITHFMFVNCCVDLRNTPALVGFTASPLPRRGTKSRGLTSAPTPSLGSHAGERRSFRLSRQYLSVNCISVSA
jgi:hypothetical protein